MASLDLDFDSELAYSYARVYRS